MAGSRVKGSTITQTRRIRSRISFKFPATIYADQHGFYFLGCHPERSEGPMHLDSRGTMHGSFAALRMTRDLQRNRIESSV